MSEIFFFKNKSRVSFIFFCVFYVLVVFLFFCFACFFFNRMILEIRVKVDMNFKGWFLGY